MKSNRTLLLADAIINLILGGLLIFFPRELVAMLGVPPADGAFYPSILGAVLFGIGIALLIERSQSGGLGLKGAIAINLSGGLVLGLWLLFGNLVLPYRGWVLLWGIVFVLFGISILEISENRGKK
jgi:hypothetical protein